VCQKEGNRKDYVQTILSTKAETVAIAREAIAGNN
jgi:hypothetical protein